MGWARCGRPVAQGTYIGRGRLNCLGEAVNWPLTERAALGRNNTVSIIGEPSLVAFASAKGNSARTYCPDRLPFEYRCKRWFQLDSRTVGCTLCGSTANFVDIMVLDYPEKNFCPLGSVISQDVLFL